MPKKDELASIQRELANAQAMLIAEQTAHQETKQRLITAEALLAQVGFRSLGMTQEHCAIQVIERAADESKAQEALTAWLSQDGVIFGRILEGHRVQLFLGADPLPPTLTYPYGVAMNQGLPDGWRYVILPPALRSKTAPTRSAPKG